MSTTILRSPRRLAALVAVAALALVGAACSDDDDGEVVVGGGTTDPTDGTTGSSGSSGSELDHPTGADEVVVRVFAGGGFVPVEFHLTATASYTLLGDGTVVEPGAVTAIYPGPAITPLHARHIDEAEIQEILQRADDAGLLDGEIDYGQPGITDVETTTVTINVDGEEHVQSAYALGFDDEAGSGPLTDEQREARRALQGFIESLGAADDPASEPYVPAEVVAYTIGVAQPDPSVPQEPQDWPIATLPAPVSEDRPFACVTITGDEATELLAALEDANQATPWVVPGETEPLSIAFRAVVPGDEPCDPDADEGPVSGSGPATTSGLVVIGDPTTTVPPNPLPTPVAPASGPPSTIPATSAAAPTT
jgi:hypothetical protein